MVLSAGHSLGTGEKAGWTQVTLAVQSAVSTAVPPYRTKGQGIVGGVGGAPEGCWSHSGVTCRAPPSSTRASSVPYGLICRRLMDSRSGPGRLRKPGPIPVPDLHMWPRFPTLDMHLGQWGVPGTSGLIQRSTLEVRPL